MSALQRSVSNVLVEMGIAHQNEYLAENGMFSVDMALLDVPPPQKVCLEVDGPYHFANNCNQPLGHTILRCVIYKASSWMSALMCTCLEIPTVLVTWLVAAINPMGIHLSVY